MKKIISRTQVANLDELRAYLERVVTYTLPALEYGMIEEEHVAVNDALGTVLVIEETLTDGSKAYNIVIK